MRRKNRLHERLSVSLDLESANLIEKLQTEYGTSKSEIVRKALHYLDALKEEEDLTPKDLEAILRLRSRPDIVSIDTGVVEAVMGEIGEGSEELRESIREIGKDLFQEYHARGVSEPLRCLERLEMTNLFSLVVDSEKNFTLVCTVREMDEFLKEFFEGFMEESPYEVDVTAGYGKVRIGLTGSGDPHKGGLSNTSQHPKTGPKTKVVDLSSPLDTG